MFKTDGPESGIFDIPDVCGEQTNRFCNEVPKTKARCDFQNGRRWTVKMVQLRFRIHSILCIKIMHPNIHCLINREEVELQIKVRKENGPCEVWTYTAILKFLIYNSMPPANCQAPRPKLMVNYSAYYMYYMSDK